MLYHLKLSKNQLLLTGVVRQGEKYYLGSSDNGETEQGCFDVLVVVTLTRITQ